MKVCDAYRPRTDFVTTTDSLRHAARRMHSTGLGCLPVLDRDAVVGIVTEHDLVDAMARGVPPSNLCVGAYASDGAISVCLTDDCAVAELKMLAIGCRNLPVVDHHKLIGMISLRDVILKQHGEAYARQ